MMEVLAGARSDPQEAQLRGLLLRVDLLPSDRVADFDAAVTIYRRCRQVGVTPRGMVDCLIAAVASRCGATVLAHDVDLARIATVTGVRLDDATLRSSG